MELSEQDRHDLRELEERLWRADFRFDHACMDEVLADDFFEFGRSGRVYSRDDCLTASGQSIDAVLPLPDFNARLLGTDVAQTTYISMVSYEGVVEYANRSSIWLRTSNGWQLKFHQGTPTAAAR